MDFFKKNLIDFEHSVLFFCTDVSSVPYKQYAQLKLYAFFLPSSQEKNHLHLQNAVP